MSNRLPFLPTRDLVIFPGVVTPVYVGRDKSIKTLERVMDNEDSKMLFGMQKDSLIENPELPKDVYEIGVIVNILQTVIKTLERVMDNEDSKMLFGMQKDSLIENPELPKDVYEIGVIVNILQTVKMPNNTIKLLVEAENRVTIIDPREVDGEYDAEYSVIECVNQDNKETVAIYRKVLEYFERYSKLGGKVLPELLISLKTTKDINNALDIIANNLYVDNQEKQKILETFDSKERGYLILDILSKEIEINEIEKKVEDKVRTKMNDAQKAYYIREKINAMKDEIQDYTPEDDNSDLKEKIEKAKLPAEVKKKVDEELRKMSKMPAFSAEASVSRNYIDVLLDLPWKKMTKDDLDIEKASKILERDHYGLKEVKDRILDYLAVKKLNPKMRGTIICLVGPPGVGKTSIARSIADAMGRKFVRVSLGGVRDEAEIRGHRRTYIGSMPGRIMKAMKLAGTKNPFILLDELDKMASDFKGDPASAMLEVLDPEQNIHFEDHYVDVPFDLSEVFFLGTANDLRNIPEPLIDRMEIIHLSSYTEYEKLHIAKQYLIKQIQEENGLKDIKVSISDKVILKIINEYTREAGVRNLKREINNLFRKIARKVVKENVEKITIFVFLYRI